MGPIEIAALFLFLALIAFVSYRFYKKVRVARSGAPKSLAIQRNEVTSDKPKTQTKAIKVIGMINCEYCGALMPQTTLTCANCGAARKK